jgi:hypothetical protein
MAGLALKKIGLSGANELKGPRLGIFSLFDLTYRLMFQTTTPLADAYCVVRGWSNYGILRG